LFFAFLSHVLNYVCLGLLAILGQPPRQRIRSHIVWRNKNTKSGKITGSKFDEVQKITLSGKKLGFSFVEIHPAPLSVITGEKQGQNHRNKLGHLLRSA